MKYRITYIKKGRKYDFVKTFTSEKYKNQKVLQYKEGSVNFKIRRL